MHIIADPQDAETVYVANVDFYKSTDGGRNFNKVKVPHGDNHGMWIDPKNPQRMIGVQRWRSHHQPRWRQEPGPARTISRPRSSTTSSTDTRTPYCVYGSQQDNSTVAIASRSDDEAIGRSDWYAVGGGEAGYIAPYPPDPNIVYAGDYEGLITRFDKRTGQTKNITAQPELSDGAGAADLEHRFQWTAPSSFRRTIPMLSTTVASACLRPPMAACTGKPSAPTSLATTRASSSPPAVQSTKTIPAPNTTTPSSPSPNRR